MFLVILSSFAVTVTLLSACATQRNTAKGRWFHSFHTRYNIYYNGSQAYIDASLEREQGNVDNFTEIIPLYTVGNKASRDLGQANYDRAIEKSKKAIKLHSIKKRPEWNKKRRKTARDIEWLNRKEYNPFLWKAWMLMGRSQFHKGNFDEAASTFAYMSRIYSTQPAIYGKARAWLAKCYVEQDWIYDAEDVITKISRDSIHWRAQKEWDYTFADYYIHTERYEEAIPYLRKVIRHEMRRKQKAREWYLLGQIYARLGQTENAYKAFRHVCRLNPPYQLDFNARIAMTEVMAGGKPKQMIRKLKRMAASDNNKDYLDQVYYAIGNIWLAEKDTTAAIANYEKGNAKATRSGIEKGVLLLTLGDLYWQLEKFSDARRCYGEAIGLLDKDRKDYEQLSKRSVILDELVPYTEAIHLQDSLQELANMSEADRNAAIDRVIEALKKKEKEEKKAAQEAEAQSQLAQQQSVGASSTAASAASASSTSTSSTFYFYNQTAVNQGKATFERLWGKRENADDWQRANKTVVASDSEEEEEEEEEELTDEQRDSIMAAEALQDSIEHAADSAVNDPHKREYYLAQIPFTDEQKAASDVIIKDGLYNSGVIFKDKLYNLRLSEKQLLRLFNQYPDYEHMDQVLYHLFLLYSQRGDHDRAAVYLQEMKESWPDSQWTRLLSDPYFAENALFGKHIEDSLYAATYDAFKVNDFKTVKNNMEMSDKRFSMGNYRDKFIFINGLSKLNAGDADGCLEEMKRVVAEYPKSEVSTLAGMIVNGVKEGRTLRGGTFDIGNVWERRAAVLADSDSIAAMKFVAERETKFVCLIAFEPDSVNRNQLLFEVARFNFSNFIMRNFGMEFDDDNGLQRMIISGFKSYDEALQYTRQLYASGSVAEIVKRGRIIIISESNMQLLGRQFSYNDYDLFYEQHFIPLKISTVRLLNEPETIEYEKEPDRAADYGDGSGDGYGGDDGDIYDIDDGVYSIDDDNTYDIEGEADEREMTIPADDGNGFDDTYSNEDLYNGGVMDDNMLLDLGIDEQPADDNTIMIPADDGGISIPDDDNAPATDDGGISIPVDDEPTAGQPDAANVVNTQQTQQTQQAQQSRQTQQTQPVQPAQPEIEDTGIYFEDDFGTSTPMTPTNTQPRQQDFNIEDEYYDLDGF